MVSCKNFEWNKNNFCQLFRGTNSATEFVDVWKKKTVFDKVLQCSHLVLSNDEPQTAVHSSPDSASDEYPIASSTLPNTEPIGNDNSLLETTERKRSLYSTPIGPPNKKKRPAPNPIDISIEEKKLVRQPYHLFSCWT